MAEKEQSGMLRIVVVLGLIAIIAAAAISSITVLRGKMDSRSNDTANLVAKQQAKEAQEQAIAAAGATESAKLTLADSNVKTASTYANNDAGTSTWQLTGNGYQGSKTYLGQDDQGQAAVIVEGSTLFTSPIIHIPDGATTMIVTARTWSKNNMYFYAYTNSEKTYGTYSRWYNGKNNVSNRLSNTMKWTTSTVSLDLANSKGAYDTKNRVVWLGFNAGNYDSIGKQSAGLSQLQVSFK